MEVEEQGLGASLGDEDPRAVPVRDVQRVGDAGVPGAMASLIEDNKAPRDKL